MKKYYAIKNPEGKVRIIEAYDKFSAIAIAVEKDNFKWNNSKYTGKKTKL